MPGQVEGPRARLAGYDEACLLGDGGGWLGLARSRTAGMVREARRKGGRYSHDAARTGGTTCSCNTGQPVEADGGGIGAAQGGGV